MGISEAKTAVELLEKTGMSQATMAGSVIALVAIVVCAFAMTKMCRLMIKWDKAQEVDRVTYRSEFRSINKVIDGHTEKIDDHEHRISILEK